MLINQLNSFKLIKRGNCETDHLLDLSIFFAIQPYNLLNNTIFYSRHGSCHILL